MCKTAGFGLPSFYHSLVLGCLSPLLLGRLSPLVLGRLSPLVLGRLSPLLLGCLSPLVLGRLSPLPLRNCISGLDFPAAAGALVGTGPKPGLDFCRGVTLTLGSGG